MTFRYARKVTFILCILYAGLTSCTKEVYLTGEALVKDGKYDSSYPHVSAADYLERMVQSVQPISCMAYYTNYYYQYSDRITLQSLSGNRYKSLASSTRPTNSNVRGTATIIYHNERRVGLITSAHVIDFPDTILSYYTTEEGRNTEYVQSVAIKSRQMNYVSTLPSMVDRSLEILAIDRKSDVAIIGGLLEEDIPGTVKVLDYPFGAADELRWGDFIYVIGYPKGKQMVTSGIVSQPNSGSNFLIDAPFNIGLSGGVVLAIRDGIPNFEIVGIANSVSADFENIISPPDTIDAAKILSEQPYAGELFIRQRSRINYGVTNVVAAEAVRDLAEKNSQTLHRKGYHLKSLFR